jgi:uracil-DNA glycosylase family 4
VSARRDAILQEMGLGPIWKLRNASAVPASDECAASPAVEPAPAGDASDAGGGGALDRAASIAAMDWEALSASVADCTACSLCRARKQAVLGVGDREADWLFVGEGPGAEEDERGEPFVGQAGKLLDSMLAAIGLRRGDNVYIANVVKCRPPNNRTPESEEMASCLPYLQRQIALLRPKLIVALGRPAAQTLLGEELSISGARGRLHRFGEAPVIVTYHPAYLLRNLPDKAKAWEDLCFARRQMRAAAED